MIHSSIELGVELLEQSVVKNTIIGGVACTELHVSNAVEQLNKMVKADQESMGFHTWSTISSYYITDGKTRAVISRDNYTWFIIPKFNEERLVWEAVIARTEYKYE